MKTFLFTLSLIVALTFGLIIGHKIWYIPKTDNTAADYFKKPNFKPDTVFMPGAFVETKIPYETKLPPKEVIKYIDTSHSSTYFTSGKNYVTYDSLGNKAKFTYEAYDRLIYAELSKDTINLTTQHLNDPPTTRVYLSDYSRYKYQILNNSINVHEYSTTKKENITQSKNYLQYNGTYVYSGYEFTNKNVSVGAQSGINIAHNKIKITGFVSTPINQKFDPVWGIRVGFKIF